MSRFDTIGGVNNDPTCSGEAADAALIAVSAVFASFGRALICLDAGFRIVHTSELIDDLVGAERARELIGKPAEELLGTDLFSADGALRQALQSGERREGWRAPLRGGDGEARFVSISAAPFQRDRQGICDPRVAYVVIVRATEEEWAGGTADTTLFSGMIGRSPSMTHLFRLVQNLQSTDATILVTGESGTGKEILAHALHEHSPRRDKRFVAVNCAALPAELLESELFGHVRGAFTGAIRDRVGRVELAAGGTLFLDEIGDLPPQVQVKLLRFLQDRTFERVGESQTRKADVRVIAATHVDLRRAIAEGKFRDDLYYRLRVVPIEIPPVRSRKEDIEPLAQHLLARVSSRNGRSVRFSPEALRAMINYSWPGNVREIENAIEYAVAVGRGQTIQPEDLPIEITTAAVMASPSSDKSDLRAVLDGHAWRRSEAAKTLGISRTTLWRRMREAGLA